MRKLAITVALACAAGAAQAAENGVYVGAGITRARLDNISAPFSRLDIDNTSWKGFAGFKFPLVPIGVEASYIDLGSETQNRPAPLPQTHADANAFAGFAVGYLPLPIPFVDFYGKAGAARWKLNSTSIDDNGTTFAWGAGAQAHFSNFAVRLEFENFNIRNTDGAKLYTLGAALYFL
jgi:opacity protein-like surface antigen